VLLSQDYINSSICYEKELPFLIWRHVARGVPLYILRAGIFTAGRAIVAVPKVGREWPEFHLLEQTDDRHPGLNLGLHDPMSGKLLSQIRKGPQRDQRMQAYAAMARAEVAAWRPPSKIVDLRDAGIQIIEPPITLPDTEIGAFPNFEVFEGRARQREILAPTLAGPALRSWG